MSKKKEKSRLNETIKNIMNINISEDIKILKYLENCKNSLASC